MWSVIISKRSENGSFDENERMRRPVLDRALEVCDEHVPEQAEPTASPSLSISYQPATYSAPLPDHHERQVLYKQTLEWLERSQLAHSLALHASLRTAHDSSMTLWLRGLKGERFTASFSDEVLLLELLAEALQFQGVVRAAQQRTNPFADTEAE